MLNTYDIRLQPLIVYKVIYWLNLSGLFKTKVAYLLSVTNTPGGKLILLSYPMLIETGINTEVLSLTPKMKDPDNLKTYKKILGWIDLDR